MNFFNFRNKTLVLLNTCSVCIPILLALNLCIDIVECTENAGNPDIKFSDNQIDDFKNAMLNGFGICSLLSRNAHDSLDVFKNSQTIFQKDPKINQEINKYIESVKIMHISLENYLLRIMKHLGRIEKRIDVLYGIDTTNRNYFDFENYTDFEKNIKVTDLACTKILRRRP